MKKRTPEEERLSTCARLHGDHPDNEVAWAELRKAALKLAASLSVTPSSGRKPQQARPPQTATEVAQVRRERKARIDDKKRRRAEWEAAQRTGR